MKTTILALALALVTALPSPTPAPVASVEIMAIPRTATPIPFAASTETTPGIVQGVDWLTDVAEASAAWEASATAVAR